MGKNIADIIDSLKGIQTFSSIVQKLNMMLMDEGVSMKALAAVIEKDPSLTATVLRLANSSYYGLAKRVSTISMAITILGLNTVRNLVTTISIFQLFKKGHCKNFDPKNLWYHSLGSAISTKALLSKEPMEVREMAFLCGIIHDIGKVVISQVLPAEMSMILEKTRKHPEVSPVKIEEDVLGFSHARIGSELAQRWCFPDAYVQVIRFHHNPALLMKKVSSNPGGTDEHENFGIIGPAVFAGNQLAKALAIGESTNVQAENIDDALWQMLRIGSDDVEEKVNDICNDFNELESSWNIA